MRRSLIIVLIHAVGRIAGFVGIRIGNMVPIFAIRSISYLRDIDILYNAKLICHSRSEILLTILTFLAVSFRILVEGGLLLGNISRTLGR